MTSETPAAARTVHIIDDDQALNRAARSFGSQSKPLTSVQKYCVRGECPH
jgi:hypothetical protein